MMRINKELQITLAKLSAVLLLYLLSSHIVFAVFAAEEFAQDEPRGVVID